MENPIHTMSSLFKQLGLPSEEADINAFVAEHKPLAPETSLADADFWSPTQSAFLAEEIAEDADWASVVDTLDAMLRH